MTEDVPDCSGSQFRSTVPAWILSVAAHALLLVAVAPFLASSSIDPPAEAEPLRRVQIVLTAVPKSETPKPEPPNSSERRQTHVVSEALREPANSPEAATAVPEERASQVAPSARHPASVQLPEVGDALRLVPTDLDLPVPTAQRPTGAMPAVADARQLGSGIRNAGGSIPAGLDTEAILAADRARLDANRPQGEPTSLSLFGGSPARGRSFIFVIDRSKSMGGEGLRALEAAEQELLKAAEGLLPHHRFQVIAYHHQCLYLRSRELLPATAENKQAIAGFLTELVAHGATEHEAALLSALQHQPDIVFLLTDGGDPQLSESQIRRLSNLADNRTAIHCIQFGFGAQAEPDSFLRRLAERTGGHYTYVNMSRR